MPINRNRNEVVDLVFLCVFLCACQLEEMGRRRQLLLLYKFSFENE